jgi:hypothetical protein
MSASHNTFLVLIPLTFVLTAQASAGEQSQKTSTAFRWLEPKTNQQLWAKIEGAFESELKIDSPSAAAPLAPIAQKFIVRVGLYQTSALVVIAQQEDPALPRQTSFQAYNYSTESERKQAIPSHVPGVMWQWRLVNVARFERAPVPDIIFQFFNCVECAAQNFLASFRYDGASKEWRWRNWEMGTSPHTGWTLLIGSSPESGFDPEEAEQKEYVYRTACVFRVADLNGDGFEDVAAWCRETAVASEAPRRVHSVKDSTLLFTAKSGKTQLLEIQDAKAAASLHHQICSIQPHAAPCDSLGSGQAPGPSR